MDNKLTEQIIEILSKSKVNLGRNSKNRTNLLDKIKKVINSYFKPQDGCVISMKPKNPNKDGAFVFTRNNSLEADKQNNYGKDLENE